VGLEISVALGFSEASVYELARTYHLLEVLVVFFLLSAPHLLRLSFRLLKRAADELFSFFTHLAVRWYRFKADVVEARSQYEQTRQTTKRKASHSVQRIVLKVSDGQSPSESPLPT
jgi:hypothetical protein